MISGSNGDKSLHIWDLENFALIKSYKNIKSTAYNNSIIKINDNILIGEKNGIRFIILSKNFDTFLYENKDLNSVLSLYYFGNNIILAGTSTGFIYIYNLIYRKDINSLKNIDIIKYNLNSINNMKDSWQNAVTCITFLGNYIIVGSIDGSMKMYNVNEK